MPSIGGGLSSTQTVVLTNAMPGGISGSGINVGVNQQQQPQFITPQSQQQQQTSGGLITLPFGRNFVKKFS